MTEETPVAARKMQSHNEAGKTDRGETSTIPVWSEETTSLNDLRSKFIEIEYSYLTQSSFHTDDLRNKFIEFYLVIVGAAGSVMLGLAQLGTRVPHWVYASAAFFLGILGMVMLPIFARLRRVVLECLQGTALLKRYVEEVINAGEDKKFSSALLWDASTLPTDESYLTASFVLIFVLMFLSSAMLALGVTLLMSAKLPVPGIWWSLAAWSAALTVQVMLYRWLLWRELTGAVENNKLRRKWAALDIKQNEILQPKRDKPLLAALLLGGAATLIFTFLARLRS